MSAIPSSVTPDPAKRRRADMTEDGARSLARRQPLRGRDIGILCDDPRCPRVVDLQRLAIELGARVALVKPELGQSDALAGLEHMARVLSALYDAVICLDLPPATVRRLREAAAIPVVRVDGGPVQGAVAPPGPEDAAGLLLSELASLCA